MEQGFFSSFLPEVTWTPPRFDELPDWSRAKRICIDFETRDDDLKELGPGVRRGAYIVGMAFSIEDDHRRDGYYLPIAHRDGGNVDKDKALAYWRDQAANFEGEILGANLGYDLDFAAEAGITFPKVSRFIDPLATDVLCNEWHDSYAMDEVAKRWGCEGKDETLLRMACAHYGYHGKKVKQHLWKIPGHYVGPYGERDVREPHLIARRQEKQIEAEDLWRVYNLECQVIPVLVELRRRGVKVNLDKVRNVESWARAQVAVQCAIATREAGREFGVADVFNGEAVNAMLTKVGYTRPRTPTGEVHYLYAGTDSLVLKDCKHPAIAAVKRARDIAKLLEYCERAYKHTHNGRMHPTYHQLRSTDDKVEDGGAKRKGKRGKGTRWGRMSATHDNIQQMPGRDDDFGGMWRACFEPDSPDHWWVSADVSQQEPRIVIDKAERLGLPGAKIAADRYRADPATDHHTMMADLTKLPRGDAKQIGNGKNYWMGDAKLARSIGLPTEWVKDERNGGWKEVAGSEARAVLDQFDRNVPYIKQLLYKAKETGEKRGYMLTTLGRRCRFRLKTPQDRDFGKGSPFADTYMALNMAVQPEAAEQMKQILVAAHKAGIPQQLTVHDEIDFSEPRGQNVKQARELREIMLNVVKIGLPWKVDLELGPNWGELTKIEKMDQESL